MNTPSVQDPEYQALLDLVKDELRKALVQEEGLENRELIQLYWWIGQEITERQEQLGRESLVELLAMDLQNVFGGRDDLSAQSLSYMQEFYQTYCYQPHLQQLVMETPWEQNLVIMSKLKHTELEQYFLKAVKDMGWSPSVLIDQIESLNQITSQVHQYERGLVEQHGFDKALLENLAAQSYQVLSDEIYFLGTPLQRSSGVDYYSFTIDSVCTARDKNGYFFGATRISFLGNEPAPKPNIQATRISKNFIRIGSSIFALCVQPYYVAAQLISEDADHFEVFIQGNTDAYKVARDSRHIFFVKYSFSYADQINYAFYRKFEPLAFYPIQVYPDAYIRAGEEFYFFGELIPEVDTASFRVIHEQIAGDSQSLIVGTERIENSIAESFQLLSDHYASDEKQIYFIYQKLEVGDKTILQVVCSCNASFVVVDKYHGVSQEKAYFGSNEIQGADISTFEGLNYGYAKDCKRVYFNGQPISGFDAASFKLLNSGVAVDKYGEHVLSFGSVAY